MPIREQASRRSTQPVRTALPPWSGRAGVRVSAIALGVFVSKMTEQYVPDYLEDRRRRVPALAPTATDARSSPRVSRQPHGGAVTDQTLPVDGGKTIG